MAGISEELRRAVLQAAIQGKLTQQLPEDGNAETLLSQIKEKKEKLIKEKKIKKEKAFSPISKAEIPFEIPDNWTWCVLTDVGNFSSGKTPDMTNKDYWENGTINWTTSKDMKNRYLSESQLKISKKAAETMRLYPAGTLLMVVRSGILKRALPLCVLTQTSTINQDLKAFDIFIPQMSEYLYYVLKGLEPDILLNYTKRVTTVDSLKFDEFSQQMPVPLPPLSEQHRIVARVEELMSKIDELEKIEKELTALRAAFPGDMKAALLQAAMQGKLTEQLDGENIDDILSSLVINTKLPRVEEYPFDIPETWRWIQIGNLGKSLGTESFSDGPFGSNLKREHQVLEPEVRIIQLSNIGEFGWRDENEKYTSFHHLENVIPRCEVEPNDFVIAKMMPAGRTIIVPNLGTRITLGSDAMKFKPNPILDKRYLLYAMHSEAFLGQVYASAHGITRIRTTLNSIKSCVLPIPPLAEQQRIVEKLDKLLPLCESLENNL